MIATQRESKSDRLESKTKSIIFLLIVTKGQNFLNTASYFAVNISSDIYLLRIRCIQVIYNERKFLVVISFFCIIYIIINVTR